MRAWLTLEEHPLPNGAVHLALRGELDLSTVAELEHRLAELLDGRADLVVDLHHLAFVDSCGLRTLLTAAQQAAREGSSLQLTRGRPQVMRVFELAGLTEFLPFLADAPEDHH
jgi:anti-sigma B factor antagonist